MAKSKFSAEEIRKGVVENMADAEIYVPDEDDVVQLVDGEQRPQEEDEISLLLKMRDTVGYEGMTEEEVAVIESYEASQKREPGEHFENLADHLSDQELRSLAQQVLEWVEQDEDARDPWQEREKKGIRLLGVSSNVESGAPFEGSSEAVHPGLGEACVQFNSRVMDVLWPAGGPVKAVVMGDTNDDLEEQAKRVAGFMNYQYTELIPGAYEQTDQLTLRLPLSGSMFTKVYYDPVDGVTRRLVMPNDFIVPYRATDLKTAPRYTERVLMQQNDVRRRQVAGLYRDIELIEPTEYTSEESREIVDDEVKATEGREDQSFRSQDHRRTLMECYCDVDLPGFEDRKDGKLTGIKLPYVVVVDKDSRETLAIYRNWKEGDETNRKIIWHNHYRFTQGLGFYGYGFYHWIGSLSSAQTGALRALLDAAAFANIPGGFRSKDSGVRNGDEAIAPGEWKEVDSDAEDLSKAFFKLPYSEPSAVLYNLMIHTEDLVQRFAGTTEALTGSGTENTPVGTILARIEQGGKVVTAIQKRLFQTMRDEFRTVAWLNSIYMQDQYPYAVPGSAETTLRSDFDQRVDVVPVADPNVISNAQQFFVSQAVIDLSDKAPDLYDRREIHKRALESLRIQNIEEILPKPNQDVMRMGPAQEIAAVLQGEPIKAYIEQNHQAHIAAHQAYFEMIDKDQQEMIGPELMAHIQEHIAMSLMIQMATQTGIPLEMLMAGEEIPVEVENQIAVATAEAMQQMQLQQQEQADLELMEMQREQERKDLESAAEIQRKDAEANAKIRREDALARGRITNQSEETTAKLQRQNEEQIASMEQKANEKSNKPDDK